jgi:hypothetical protein
MGTNIPPSTLPELPDKLQCPPITSTNILAVFRDAVMSYYLHWVITDRAEHFDDSARYAAEIEEGVRGLVERDKTALLMFFTPAQLELGECTVAESGMPGDIDNPTRTTLTLPWKEEMESGHEDQAKGSKH